MSIFERISRVFTNDGSTQPQLEPHRREGTLAADVTDWRKQRLAAAAKKYGRPFKCAGDDLPREVFVAGRYLVTVDAGCEVPGQEESQARARTKTAQRHS